MEPYFESGAGLALGWAGGWAGLGAWAGGWGWAGWAGLCIWAVGSAAVLGLVGWARLGALKRKLV